MRTKLSRNDKCWCGSGKKYKNCHQDKEYKNILSNSHPLQKDGLILDNQSLFKYIQSLPPKHKKILDLILKQKKDLQRHRPSGNCILGTSQISPKIRLALLDLVASVVDDNFWGRSEMCVYFAILLRDALVKIGYTAQAILGSATYHSPIDSTKDFIWEHAWVNLDNEIIDGNIDSLVENPHVNSQAQIFPSAYWGTITELPNDRTLVPKQVISLEWEIENTTVETLQDWRSAIFRVLSSINTKENNVVQ
jgi:hypothetical protein